MYATRAYTAEVLDWQRRFTKVLQDASAVTAPVLGLKLELVEARDWPLKHDNEDVHRLITDLHALDEGKDVDWVVGLASSMPRFATSFHELGVGEQPGKHIVLRAITNAAEYEAIETGLDELSEEQRDRFRRERLAHKVTTVLLHELGHTLGALHERNPKSIMNPDYNHQTSDYGSDAVDLMRLMLAHRTPNGSIEASSRQALIDVLQRPSNPWIPQEREDALKLLASAPATATPGPAAAGAASPTPRPAAVSPSPSPEALATLSDADKRVFTRAKALKDERKFDQALELARPLFEAYPSVEVVQELRCQIASERGMEWASVDAECKPYMKLMLSPKGAAH